MSGKRGATSELNHENWNNDEDPEDSGTFTRASDDVIKTRVIKTARRKIPNSSVSSESDKKNVFGSFSGFTRPSVPTSNPFGFLSHASSKKPPKTNGIPECRETISTTRTASSVALKSTSTVPPPISSQPSWTTVPVATTSTVPALTSTDPAWTSTVPTSITIVPEPSVPDPSKSPSLDGDKEKDDILYEYYAKLKGLNQGVSKWIKQHVDENPLINLQPIFQDYERFFEQLEKQYRSNESDSKSVLKTKPPEEPKANARTSTANSSLSAIVFKPSEKLSTEQLKEKPAVTCSFGTPSITPKQAPKLSFGITSTGNKSTSGNNATEATKISFGTTNTPKQVSQAVVSSTETPTRDGFGIPNTTDSTITSTNTKKAPSFSFGIPNASKIVSSTTTEPAKFSFGIPNSSEAAATTSETAPLSFGVPNISKPFTTTSETPKPTFSFGIQKQTNSPEKPTALMSEAPKFSFGSENTTKQTTDSDKLNTTKQSTNLEESTANIASAPKFSFGNITTASSAINKTDTPKFSFGSVSSTSVTQNNTEKPQFSFGSGNATATSKLFAFGSADLQKNTGFTFKNVANPFTGSGFGKPAPTESNEEKQNENEEEEEPPKPEFKPVVEEGHVYTTRCKVFVKKDKVFGDRGVGTLYLKPVPDSEKTQLIVRADTNLGNLLCNFILSEGINMQRMGKKDVMMICLPTPDHKPPPVPILIRVKSPEEADKLLEMLEKHKK